MALKCVPFLHELAGDTKLDAHAIYARPNGDLTSGLPMRRHSGWTKKGFKYVTLADAESFKLAVPFLRQQNLDPKDYVCGNDGDGRPTCWNVELYLEDHTAKQAAADAELKAMVEKFGAETVEAIKGIKVPDHLKPAESKVKAAKVSVQ